MHRRIRWDQEIEWLKAGLSGNGAFLNVNTPSGRTNPMTIGWGQVGVVWGRPVFSVFVRTNRYTFECLQAAASFSVSVPRLGELSEALTLCGSRSGRELDKVEACELQLLPGRSIDTPILAACGLHYECTILARAQLKEADMVSDEVHRRYESQDLHQIVLGEILDAYVLESE